MNVKIFLILLLTSQQLSCNLMELTIFDTFLGIYATTFHGGQGRLNIGLGFGLFLIAYLRNRVLRFFTGFLLHFVFLFSHEHRFFFIFLFLFDLSIMWVTSSESSENKSSSLGRSRPNKAFFFFLNTLVYTFTMLVNLIGGLSAFLDFK